MWQWGATAGEIIVDKLHGWGLVGFTRACVVASIFLALGGCGTSNLAPTAGVASADAVDFVRNTGFSPRFPVGDEGNFGQCGKTRETRGSTEQPFLVSG